MSEQVVNKELLNKVEIFGSGNINFEPLNPADYPDWDNLLKTNSAASFFHCSSWSKVLTDTYKYTPLYFTSVVNNRLQRLIPVMEINSILTGNRGVSLPFSDYCEPIITEQLCLEEVIDSMVDYGRKAGWKYLELKSADGLSEDWPCLDSYYGHSLELCRDPAAIFSGFKRTIRQNIRKAQKKGVQTHQCHDLASVKEFYRLNCLTRKRHGLPPQPYNFFRKIFDYVISKKLGFVLLARYKQAAIAGGIFFHFGKNAIYKYNALDKKYQHLRPSDLITWKAIEWYCEKGFDELCFGRTDSENEGLRRFKKGWGVEERFIKYYRYNFARQCFVKRPGSERSSSVIFRVMPVPVLRMIGSLLYKHIG